MIRLFVFVATVPSWFGLFPFAATTTTSVFFPIVPSTTVLRTLVYVRVAEDPKEALDVPDILGSCIRMLTDVIETLVEALSDADPRIDPEAAIEIVADPVANFSPRRTPFADTDTFDRPEAATAPLKMAL